MAELRQARQRDFNLLEAAKSNLRRVIRKAKQEYWHSQIAKALAGKDIFQMIN
jgi:post-segregation antitoxin (ccd killing protein)